jgi:chitin disaccharide deacetylase
MSDQWKTQLNTDKMKKILSLLVSIVICTIATAQTTKNLAELLGYQKDAKLLIIHADDMGLSHSVNTATLQAFEKKGITSGSIMVPCPWANEIIAYIKNHPDIDAGIHITLTAEWDQYRWGGLSSSDQIKSLLDADNYLYPSVEALGKSVVVAEAEKEMRAQIDKVIAAGIKSTHIDTHMGSVMATPELVQAYLGLSDLYHLPVLFPRAYLGWFPPEAAKAMSEKIFLLDNLFMLEPSMLTGKWIDPYRKAVESMKPGLNEIIVHVAIDNEEMQAITGEHKDYGSKWRQNDLELVNSKEFHDLLKSNNIILIGWKQVRDAMNSQTR